MGILLQILLALLFLGAAAFYYRYVYLLNKTLKFYSDQGVRVMPGATRPLIGNLIEFGGHPEAAEKSEKPIPIIYKWAESVYFDPEMPKGFDYEKNPAYIFNFFGNTCLSIFDPAIVQELFTTKNKLIDKDGLFQ